MKINMKYDPELDQWRTGWSEHDWLHFKMGFSAGVIAMSLLILAHRWGGF